MVRSKALSFVVPVILPTLMACARAAPLPAKAVLLNRDGAAALAAGDLEMAEARIALALEYNPRFTEAWVNLGLIEMRRGNFERAERDLVKARDLNPDLPAPHHALGLLCEYAGSLDDAEMHYRAALKVDPGFAPARINLGRRLFERGAFEESREHFLRLTQVAPEFPEGWTGLGELLLRLDRVGEAGEVLAHARERLGSRPGLDLLEARILLRRNAFAAAEERLEPLTRLSDRKEVATAFAWLSVARFGQGDSPGAVAAAKQALLLDPQERVARYALQTVRGGAPAAAAK
jgi:tetratricopeptide (TPR) repeat protein